MRRALVSTLIALLPLTNARAADVGVTATKLVVVDKLAASGSAKTVFIAKDPGVTKGSGTDPASVSVTLDITVDGSSVGGAFALPAGAHDGTSGWVTNGPAVAKFVNASAPSGPTQAKVAVVKPGKLLKLVAKGTGDAPLDVLAAPPSGDVHSTYCVTNDGEETCHCSTFSACTWKSISAGSGAKLVCKGGTPDPSCSGLTRVPTLPTPTAACPTIVDGDVTFLGRSIRIWVDPVAAAAQDGPVVFMWHGLGGSPSQLLLDVMISTAGRTAIVAQGGLIVGMRTDPASTSPFDWQRSDLDIADEVLACAAQQFGIDATRIHSVGVSAGGLQTSLMSYWRSSYLASVVSYSGGAIAQDEDPSNKLSAMVVHGGDSDIFILNFKATSELYFNDLLSRDRFAFICDHGLGHTIPLDIGDDAWRFLQDHPYRVQPFPYAGGLPATFPSYCGLTIPQ